ncbi:MAG: hypothetical protein Q8N87_02210 [bacterium]|nr:hypothetical protein [bacterium]
MLEDKDVQKLIEVFATREELNVELTNIKEDLKEARSERLELKTRINDTYNKEKLGVDLS